VPKIALDLALFLLRTHSSSIVASLCALSWCCPGFAGSATVLSVGDGDTLTVSEGGRRATIRLACVDAPETSQTPYGSSARASLQALAPVGSSVNLQGGKRDRYGRTVAEVFRGRTNVNLELVRKGEAFVYRRYLTGCDRNTYIPAEQQAESSRKGVWSVPGGITRPWDWRHGRAPRPSSAPPANSSPTGRFRCRDIGSWDKAQQLLRQGHAYLDGDRDGNACESLR
jgi:endonuclease YncB( thermonuclease family)